MEAPYVGVEGVSDCLIGVARVVEQDNRPSGTDPLSIRDDKDRFECYCTQRNQSGLLNHDAP